MPDGPDHPETWVFHLAMAWLGDPDHSLSYPERLALIKEKTKTLGEPTRSAFAWIPDDTLVHKADISFWVSKQWDNRDGRMTLVGDAAHPMPPYRGQGLNHCICDSSHLLDKIQSVLKKETTLKEAISAYDDEVVKRGSEEVKCSLENGMMLHDWEKVTKSPVFTTGFKPMTGHDGVKAHDKMTPGEAEAVQTVMREIEAH
jgi:FAD binding domain